MNFYIRNYESLGSTNEKAKEVAASSKEGTIIIAREQSGGKGRFGRPWISSKDKGLWMSIILKPSISLNKLPKFGLLVSAVVYKSLEDIGIKTGIKWPNDIILEDKKICGILIEIDASMDKLNHIILGIGLNINQDLQDFPEEIQSKAGSLKMFTNRQVNIDIILDRILNNFNKFYRPFVEKDDIEEALRINKDNSLLLGKEVYIINSKGEKRKGLALDINKQGELVVEFSEGIEKVLAGEVSVRGLEGYI